MYTFIDAYRDAYGVEPICRLLEIAPSGYYVHRARQADPCRRRARALRDERRCGTCGGRTTRYMVCGRYGDSSGEMAPTSRAALCSG